jgi:uncharacterized membrane protein
MHEAGAALAQLEAAASQGLRIVGLAIEVAAAAVIVAGLVWSSAAYVRKRMGEPQYESYKIRIGRSLLLGLEVVVAADIVKTIAAAPTLMSLAVLGGLVIIRTFLSWTLVLEIEGRWPWQRAVDRAPRAELVRCRPHPACGPYIDPMPSRHFSCRFRAAMLLQQSRMR